jgi:hypothetical protein
MARWAVEEHGPVEVVQLEDLPAGAVVMPCGQIGAPLLAAERIWGGDEGAVLRDTVEEIRSAPVHALMPLEIGGAGGVLPVIWAARMGLPLVDADGRGRAFPSLLQQAMHLAGVPAAPTVLTDGRGNTLVLRSADDDWAEHLTRGGVARLGGICAAALYCMTATEAADAAIAGSLSRAHRLGTAMNGNGATPQGWTALIQGRVRDLERGFHDGVIRGSATVQSTRDHESRLLRIEFQNEFLVAIEDGGVCASVPDVISVQAGPTGDPIQVERLAQGQGVTVMVGSAPAVWRTDEGLALVGPRAFGYEVDYAPPAGEDGDDGAG